MSIWMWVVIGIVGFFVCGGLLGPPAAAVLYGMIMDDCSWSYAIDTTVDGCGMTALFVCLWWHSIAMLLIIAVLWIPYQVLIKPFGCLVHKCWSN